MTWYRVEYQTEGREIYVVEAENEEAACERATEAAEDGIEPSISEVTGVSLVGAYPEEDE
jgi:hypothetical protein